MLILYLSFIIIFYFAYLLYENVQNKANRNSIAHVIHINGTRGKSSSVRLIDAGLRAGGLRTFCKTTGTLPMTINTRGEEAQIKRRGRANIKEQIKTLRQAALEHAEVLVVECMAVSPVLQNISQHKILKADLVAITNTRADHLDEMGSTIAEIANSLSNTLPARGQFFTCDDQNFHFFQQKCTALGTSAVLVAQTDVEYGFDFNENIELALAICQSLGVDRATALEGMRHYSRDPFALSLYEIKTANAASVLFVNGFSINDPDSIEEVVRKLRQKNYFANRRFILLINNRQDRSYRMEQHSALVSSLKPDALWLTGAYTRLMKKKAESLDDPPLDISILRKAEDLDLKALTEDSIVFAIGNIAQNGAKIVKIAMEAGELFEQ